MEQNQQNSLFHATQNCLVNSKKKESAKSRKIEDELLSSNLILLWLRESVGEKGRPIQIMG